MPTKPQDEQFLRQAIDAARSAREQGNHPFGALIASPDGSILAIAGNTVHTGHDVTQHAETNAIRAAFAVHDAEALKSATLYTSTEPCPMCCGAIHWAGIPRIVYGCSAVTLAGIVRSNDFLIPSREIFARTTQPPVEIVGPLLEPEAIAVHAGYWG